MLQIVELLKKTEQAEIKLVPADDLRSGGSQDNVMLNAHAKYAFKSLSC